MPKAFFAADGAFRRGKAVEMKSIADEAAENIPTLKHMIVLKADGAKYKDERGKRFMVA
jgi:acetyl-CoA synthetase